MISSVALGSSVAMGDTLGIITDPITNETVSLTAPADGRVIGMARNQVVMPGFAAFHLGLVQVGQSADTPASDADDPSE